MVLRGFQVLFTRDPSAGKSETKRELPIAPSSVYTHHVCATGYVGDGKLCVLQLALGNAESDAVL